MKPIPVLGIPHFNRPDLTARCIASIDYPVETLVLVSQGPQNKERIEIRGNQITLITTVSEREVEGIVAQRATHRVLGLIPSLVKNTVVIQHPNAGVAGAWNEIIKLFPAEWWLIVNNDIQFAEGDLEGMARRMADHGVQTPVVLYGNHGASWFAVTAPAIEVVGLFDENLYPAYLEDCDFGYRCDLSNVPRITCHGLKSVHGDEKLKGSCTIHSNPELAIQNCRTHGGNFVYYEAKWGGRNGSEKYKQPFNDVSQPVWAWKFRPQIRAQQQWAG